MSKVDLNCHCGSGNLWKKPELRHVGDKNTPLVDLMVAMTVGFGSKQKTVWTKVQVWGKQAEIVAQYAEKGDKIFWTGATYEVDEYKNREGEDKRTHYFTCGMGSLVNIESKASKQSREDGRDDAGHDEHMRNQEQQEPQSQESGDSQDSW